MSEWKGPWKCEKCGAIENHEGTHRDSPFSVCMGKLVPHDRRTPDPEKAELAELLLEARAGLDYHWVRFYRAKVCRIDAVLKRHKQCKK